MVGIVDRLSIFPFTYMYMYMAVLYTEVVCYRECPIANLHSKISKIKVSQCSVLNKEQGWSKGKVLGCEAHRRIFLLDTARWLHVNRFCV